MPELPEVEAVRSYLNKNTKNKVIKNIVFENSKLIKKIEPESFKKNLLNERIEKVERYAKYLLIYSKNFVLISHLRMEGKYFYFKNGKFNDESLKKHIMVSFLFTNGDILAYHDVRKFGTMELYSRNDFKISKQLSKLGKEPFDLNIDEFYNKLQKKNIEIKKALLDQTIIAGIGNIYCDEILFDVQISPLRSTKSITKNEAKNIKNSAIRILKKAVQERGTTIRTFSFDFSTKGNYQKFLNAYSKEGQTCSRCKKNKLIKIKVSGRGTVYCAKCQK